MAGLVKPHNLDVPEAREGRLGREEELLFRGLEKRIQLGRFELPRLPSTTLAIIEMASDAGAELAPIIARLRTDPVLTAEILRAANSALRAAAAPIETLEAAVMRLGLRGLRSTLFALSMRNVVFGGGSLLGVAEEIWRQVTSMAAIAQNLARHAAALPPERAWILGLLHDIGKVSLLALLRRERPRGPEPSRTLIGRVFHHFHEPAGAALAKSWRLPPDIISVAGCHHDFRENLDHPREAALASLSHKIDIVLSLGQDPVHDLLDTPELPALGIPPEDAWTALSPPKPPPT